MIFHLTLAQVLCNTSPGQYYILLLFATLLYVYTVCSLLFSASTDKTGGIWDLDTGVRVRKLKEHTSFVNSCAATKKGAQYVITGSDDGTVKVNPLKRTLIC